MSDEGQIWRFGAFELNPGSRQLLKNGVRLKIQEQPFQVLSALVQRRGEVVGRDELRRRVWSDETFVDYDNGLNVSIAKLRQALGDNSDNPAYIETLPRIGYRFIARVEVLPLEEPPAKSGRRHRLMVFGLAFAAAVAGIALWMPLAKSSGAGGPAIPLRPSVAIMGFRNLTSQPDQNWLSTAISEMLATELSAGEYLRVIPGESVALSKSEMGLPDVESYSAQTLAQIRKRLGADYVLVGSFLETGSPARHIRLDLRLQDAKTGDTVALRPQNAGEDDLAGLVVQAGLAVRQKLPAGSFSQSGAGAVPVALAPNFDSARLYAEGLNRLRRFDARGSRDLLEQAVAADPTYALAHAALSEAWSALGYAEVARNEARKAWQLSAQLPPADRLSIEARYRETNSEWDQASRIYRRLSQQFPDNSQYGLRLAGAQANAGRAAEALVTLESLRKFPFPLADDAAINFAQSQAAEKLGDFEQAQAAAARAAASAHGREAQTQEADARALECRQLVQLSRLDEAAAVCESARQIYARTGNRPGLAAAMAYLAAADCNRGNTSNARDLYTQAVVIDREIGNVRGDAQWALNGLAVLLFQAGDLAGARNLYEESFGMARAVGSRADEASALGNIGSMWLVEGNLPRARKFFEQAPERSREVGARAVWGSAANNLGHTLYLQGELAEAAKMLDQAVEADRQTGAKLECADALSWLGRVRAAQADWDGARRNLEESVRLAGQISGPVYAAKYRLARAELMLFTGHVDQAEGPILEGLEIFRRAKAADRELESRVLLARVFLEEGKSEEARQELGRAEILAQASRQSAQRVALSIVTARIAAASGSFPDLARAARELETSIAGARRLGFLGYQLEARLVLGEIESKKGRGPVARGILEKVEKDARASGFEAIARDAVRQKVADAGLSQITPRKREGS